MTYGPDSEFRMRDEYEVVSVEGIPYGVLDMHDLALDLIRRMMMWIYSQAGEDGMDVANASVIASNISPMLAAALRDGDIPDEMKGARIGRAEPSDSDE